MAGDFLMSTNGNGNGLSDPRRTYQVVVAATRAMGIGKDGKLPWNLPSDLKFFKEITMKTSDPVKKNAVLMGRKTWESIPVENRPLPGRLNVVLTRSGSFDIATAENVVICGSMASALELLAASPYCLSIEKVFVIGGGEILRETLNAPGCDAIHISEIETSFESVTHSCLRLITLYFSHVDSLSQNGDLNFDSGSDSGKFEIEKFSFLPKMIFERHEEYLYLQMVREIIFDGTPKDDRTGTGTLSKCGSICAKRFHFLLLRYVYLSAPEHEYKLLSLSGVNAPGLPSNWFWRVGSVARRFYCLEASPKGSSLERKYFGEVLLKNFYGLSVVQQMPRSFRKKAFIFGMAMLPETTLIGNIGLTDREEGDLGPVYGFQWRHFGARYTDMHADYSGQGFDQLLDVLHKIKNNPDDRRIILSAWNPSDLKLMALPACHMFAQFYVANGELSCQMYQRSADMGLGVPFNIASYALLTCMIAHCMTSVSDTASDDLVPGDFIHVIGDAHVYRTHIRPLQEQLQKLPKPFPILRINPEKKNIDSFVAADFKLVGYDPHQKIEMKMAVQLLEVYVAIEFYTNKELLVDYT
uniref:Bifunctional dihydrofolate reductase-thymidylate synthase n=1 Tax=Fagus sylvatica TaxID=28930 RepID=A0A2N9J6Q7_FAGSY